MRAVTNAARLARLVRNVEHIVCHVQPRAPRPRGTSQPLPQCDTQLQLVQVLELPPHSLPLQAASFTALEKLVVRRPPEEGTEAAWDAILFGLR